MFHPNNCVLQLMAQEGKNLHVKKEVAMLDSKKVAIAFSPDGKWFALFRVALNILRIFKIDDKDVLGLMGKVERGEPDDYHKEYKYHDLLKASEFSNHNEIRM